MKYLGILNPRNLGPILRSMVVMVFIDGLTRKRSLTERNGSVEVVTHASCLGT